MFLFVANVQHNIIVQQFTDEKSPFNLKTALKKLIFASEKPQVICEDSALFTMVMSTFTQHEKYVSAFVKYLRQLWDTDGIP